MAAETVTPDTGQDASEVVTIDIQRTAQNDDELYTVSTNSVSPTNDLGMALPMFFPPGFKIQPSQLPQPMPFFGRLAGYNPGYTVATNLRNCIVAARSVERPLTLDECNALTFNTTKSLSISSYGAPLGGIAAATRWYTTRATMKFPFFKPNSKAINLDKFLGLRGWQARIMWNQTRFLAYAICGIPFGKVLIASYAMSVLVTAQSRDPRLSEFWNEIKERHASGMQGVATGVPIPIPAPGQHTQLDPGMYSSPPPDGPEPQTQGSDSSWSGASYGTSNNTQSNTRSMNQQPDYTGAPQRPSSGFDFDDASPVAKGEQSVSSEPGGGSAWERLRRGQPPPPRSQQPSRPQRPGTSQDAWARTRTQGDMDPENERGASPTGDNLAEYTGSEADRQRAKEQAQRDFDARIDRERRGESFDGESPRKW